MAEEVRIDYFPAIGFGEHLVLEELAGGLHEGVVEGLVVVLRLVGPPEIQREHPGEKKRPHRRTGGSGISIGGRGSYGQVPVVSRVVPPHWLDGTVLRSLYTPPEYFCPHELSAVPPSPTITHHTLYPVGTLVQL